jgi:rSAM/selenodomain-associated transferase 1
MVADIIENIIGFGLPLYLFHDGEDAIDLPKEWVDAADDIVSQRGDSLGERMATAFNFLFSIGQERVILVGSDIPGIDAELLQSAIETIEGFDMVFSPAFDGGYCLVASKLRSFNDSIFQNIPWSTSSVMETTLDICNTDGLTYKILDTRQDIDTLEDIVAYCRHPFPQASSTNNWLSTQGYFK